MRGADGRAQKLLALADPSGIAPAVVTLPPFGAAVIELCDGTRTCDEIAAEFAVRYRRPLPKEALEALLKKLDDALLLDSSNFRMHCARLFAEFAGQDTRPPLFAGRRYPSEPEAIYQLLLRSFTPPNGPGLPVAAAGQGSKEPDAAPLPFAIVTPTLDLDRGGAAYAWAYRPLLEVPRLPSLIVLVGCDSSAYDPLVTLTRKHFATPIGTLHTDVELVDALCADAAGMGANSSSGSAEPLADLLTRDEAHHRGEHSLELAVVWLRFILEWRKRSGRVDEAPPRILPILCGSLRELAQNPKSADDKLEPHQTTRLFDEFASLLRRRIDERKERGESVLWIGAANLAHVGPRFGDPQPLSEDDRDSLERRDSETLLPVLAGDAGGFLTEIRRERDRRRVEGLGALFFLLTAARPGKGRLRCYAQCAVDPSGEPGLESGSYISTASLIYP